MTSPAISVVVPLHNEQMVLPELLRRVSSVLNGMPGGPHEMIFVDDGSSDATLQILEEAASLDSRISVIVFAPNFGHGSGRIHLPEAQAQDYRWLVRQLDDHCDVFVGFPELPSLHIWTEKDPLDGMQMNDWMLYTSGQQQMAVSAFLSGHPNACAIYNLSLVDFWNHTHQDLEQLPLVRYLHENFKIAGASSQFSFLVRNERDLTLASDP